MSGIILTCNAGSSNTKLAAFDSATLEQQGHTITHNTAETIEWLCAVGEKGIKAVGHRVVHGGRRFIQPQLLDDTIISELTSYTALAPLHQPSALKLIAQAQKLYPKVPHVACFDTAFHHTIPEIERQFPLPESYYKKGIQRYGFHGISYQYIASVLPEYAGALAEKRVIVAHLGGGSSACAMKGLKSIASTMGFSTLDGMMMGTRPGAIDAGVILHLLGTLKMSEEEITRLLYTESGLLGTSGISADMAQLLGDKNDKAQAAIELYCYLAARQIASLLPAIKGIDVLVFTGGIGENSPEIREKITAALRWAGDFAIHIIPTNEAQIIAQLCQAYIGNQVSAA